MVNRVKRKKMEQKGIEKNYFKFFRKSMKNELTNSWYCDIMFFVNAVVAELADAQD